MTKPSPILITKLHPLENMPEHELAVVRRFLFDGIRGLNEEHNVRWHRLWFRIVRGEVGEVFQLENVVARNGAYHRMHLKFEQDLFNSQEKFLHIERFRDWLKVGAGWGRYELNKHGVMKFIPSSESYEKCSDDEMRMLHPKMVEFIRTPKAQRRLWGHLPPERRVEMVEAIVSPPERSER